VDGAASLVERLAGECAQVIRALQEIEGERQP
jgi:hypothetical protein